MATVLAVDDDERVRRLVLRAVESMGHDGLEAGTVADARRLLSTSDVDVVVCDVNLPDSSGLLLAREIAEQLPDTALFMLSGDDDPNVAEAALSLGATAYVLKPFVQNEIVINVTNSLRLRDGELRRRRANAALETVAITRPVSLAAVLGDLADPASRDQQSDAELAQRLAGTLALRDDELGSHIERTSAYAYVLARALSLDEQYARNVSLATMLHDIGKIGVPDEILIEAHPLDEAEMDVMRRHAELGHRLLAASDAPLLQLAATIALTHHERWDGSGYPRGLAGDAIPLEGRIAAVADVFDALTTDRNDRPAHPIDEAVELILAGAGTQFDPAVVDAFERGLDEIRTLRPPPDEDSVDLPPSISVLVVDDHQMFAESVIRLIDREPDLHVVGMATSVTDGINKTRAEKPAVVLMDWDLPDGDGVAAARSILDELPETKVVLLTGRSDDSLLVSALRAGCAGFVSKVDALSTLVSAVRTAAAGDPAVPTGKLVTLLSRLEQQEPIRGSHTRLSARELEVLTLLARGLDADAIAARLVLSGHTVRNHLRNAMAKLDAHTRLEAVTTAARRGLIDLA